MPTYTSVAEIYEAIDETRARLIETIEGAGAARADIRDAPGRWSVAEVAEHLALIEGQLAKLFDRLVARAEADGAPPAAPGGSIPPVSPDEMAERSRDRIEAPEFVRPAGATPLSESLASLRESRAALHRLRPRVEALDLREVRYPHPLFGPLDLYHWLAFIGLHEERHLRQIEALLSASGAGMGAGGASADAG